MTQQLTIMSRQIRIKNDLYLLNDIHKASGSYERNRPARFLRSQQTKELIAEIQSCTKSGQLAIEAFNGVGTYACKELVYAYAMWISPKFHLHVIRAFDQMNIKPALPAVPQNYRILTTFEHGQVIDTKHLSKDDFITNYNIMAKQIQERFMIDSDQLRDIAMACIDLLVTHSKLKPIYRDKPA
jgi:hypothetical protein